MRIHVLGGFLGSGKTTILMKLASSYAKEGKKVSIIVNEAGDIGVDGATIKGDGFNTTELPDGCICCSLTVSLQEAIVNIVDQLHPDVIIIEPTGLAIPSRIVEAIEGVKDLDKDMDIIGIVDAHRFGIFADKKPTFITEQIRGSDLILMNKIDVATPEQQESVRRWIADNIGRSDIIGVSAKTGEGMEQALEAIRND